MPTPTYNVVSVANVAALYTLDGSVAGTAPLIYTQSFSTLSSTTMSGGGALAYVWNSTDSRSDDGVTILDPTGHAGNGRWNAIFDTISARDAGAVGDGSTNDHTALSTGLSVSSSTGIPFTIGPTPDSYVNSATISWTGGDGAVRIDPGAVFSGSGGPPVLTSLSGLGDSASGLDFARKTFDTTWTTKNVFMFCRAGISNDTSGNLVVIQGTAQANANNTSVWASEFSVVANEIPDENPTMGLTGIEVGALNNAGSNALLDGILIVCNGSYAANNALTVQVYSGASISWTNGLYFNNSGGAVAISGSLIQSTGSNCENGIYLTGTFSDAELDTPSFKVGPTVASLSNRVGVTAAISGSPPTISAIGADTNIGLYLKPRGSGLVTFGTFTSDATATIAGYITISDAGGTTRHLAVVNP